MLIIDTHAHVSLWWFEPVEVLLSHMDRVGVAQAVLLQFFGQEDNRYIIECSARYPGRFAPVVCVDPSRTDAPETLRRWVVAGAKGLRLRCDDRSPGRDPLAIWRVAASAGVPISCLGTTGQFVDSNFRTLVAQLPEVPIVMEHFGLFKQVSAPYTQLRDLESLAKLPNLYVKIGCLGELSPRRTPFDPSSPFASDASPVLQMLFQAFGPKRIMWGSDYPLVCGREGYRSGLELIRAQMPGSAQDKEWIFGKTASTFFKFEPAP